MTSPSGDYLERLSPFWNQDPQAAIDAVEGIKNRGEDLDVLMVDWRNDFSRHESGLFLAHVGLKIVDGGFLPLHDNPTRLHETEKGKLFFDYVHPYTNSVNMLLTITERRIVLPYEGVAVGSLFRASSARIPRAD